MTDTRRVSFSHMTPPAAVGIVSFTTSGRQYPCAGHIAGKIQREHTVERAGNVDALRSPPRGFPAAVIHEAIVPSGSRCPSDAGLAMPPAMPYGVVPIGLRTREWTTLALGICCAERDGESCAACMALSYSRWR